MRYLGWVTVAVTIMYIYGSIAHGYRPNRVAPYHQYWPETCAGSIRTSNNPNHHPAFCWKYFDPPGLPSTQYPVRTRIDTEDESPYSTATSFAYFALAIVFIIMVDRDNDGDGIQWYQDVGGIVLSLGWVAAASANMHRAGGVVADYSDWHTIGPLMTWVGAHALMLGTNFVFSHVVKFILVFIAIYIGYYSEKLTVYVGAATLGVGYVVVYHAHLLRTKRADLNTAINFATAFLFGITAAVCQTYGDTFDDSVWYSSIVPSHGHGINARCKHNINSARLDDLGHATWHVFTMMGLWVIITTTFELQPFTSRAQHIAYILSAIAVILTTWFNPDNYPVWIVIVYGGLAAQLGTSFWPHDDDNGYTKVDK
jgi:hypothetical protein